mgnify:CR=1 FL=1
MELNQNEWFLFDNEQSTRNRKELPSFIHLLKIMVSVRTIQAATVFAWFMLLMLIRRLVLLIFISITKRQTSDSSTSKTVRRGQVEPSTTAVNRTESTVDMRVNRIIGNDSENDTYFLILLLSTAAFSDSVNGDCVRTIVYAVIYLFVRIVYAIVYALGLQPWRTLVFYFAFACTLACNLDLVITMSRRAN